MDIRDSYGSAFFAYFKNSAVHYPVRPKEVDAWLSSGNEGNTITDGTLSSQETLESAGNVDQVKATPFYRMPTSRYTELGIKADHTLEVNSVRYRIVYGRPRNGLHELRLQATR